jgi:hypothetical protein
MSRSTKWKNPQLQEHLAELSARGMSAAQIAEQIGVTRDAVKSAMSRYGLFASSGRRLTKYSRAEDGAADHDR